MEKYIINIDTKQTREKPRTGSCEFGLISNRVAEHIEELSLEKIIDEVGNKGKAFCRALLIGGQRKEENFQRQIFLGLDFDSNPDYEAFKRKCREYNLQYTFTYRTSDSGVPYSFGDNESEIIVEVTEGEPYNIQNLE